MILVLELVRFCILGCSRGVSYALGYALQHPERIAGIVLADYPPIHTALSPDMPAEFMTTTWRNKPATQRIRLETLKAIQSDSRRVEFAERLRELHVPVLVLAVLAIVVLPSRG